MTKLATCSTAKSTSITRLLIFLLLSSDQYYVVEGSKRTPFYVGTTTATTATTRYDKNNINNRRQRKSATSFGLQKKKTHIRGGDSGAGGVGEVVAAETLPSSQEQEQGNASVTSTAPVRSNVTGGGGSSSTATNSLPTTTGTYSISECQHQGERSYMEDEHYISQSGEFAAVFDGHGGQAVSRYLRQNLYANLQVVLPSVTRDSSRNVTCKGETIQEDDQNGCQGTEDGNHDERSTVTAKTSASPPTLNDYEQALKQALDKVDGEVQRISHWSYQGSTAVAVWVHEEKRESASSDPPRRTILAANVGDSRAVLSRAGAAMDLTRDHKPNDPFEKARVEGLGGKVIWCGLVDSNGKPVENGGVYRINGNLALSRAIGDRSERPLVSAEPEFTHSVIDESDEFIVLGSDGLWDVMSSQEVVSFVHSKLDTIKKESTTDADECEIELPSSTEGKSAALKIEMSSLVTAEALRRGTTDNVTVVIIWLKDGPKI
eukprot:CAMPEP_0195288292 /NCGR_PEP_ID=MMETSP0707-20130614/5015_1 /TAXON_ID=33640 /ORGANISM="Asterionellopsis glacialis, Strain CCMP134" /LENGTH=489 /DNA_ID=CAMNT_0040348143 /DNA_START=292 /DNA_END=1761 /DNA_ORIENTATION=+